MPVPVPTWTTALAPGGYVTSAWGNTIGQNGTFLTNVPLATLLQTAATQSFTTATWTTLTWDNTANVDTYGGYNSGSSNTRYTAQVSGYYRVRGVLAISLNTSGVRLAKILKNGTAVQGAQTRLPPTNAIGMTVPVEWTLYLAAGDYVELQGYQSSGGNLSTLIDAESCSSLQITWLHA